MMRLIGKIVLGILLFLVGAVLLYVLYMLVTYRRIEDFQELAVQKPGEVTDQREDPEAEKAERLTAGESYRAMTYNIGFGAYTPEYSFFMDGGKSSWAESKESVIACVEGAAELMKSYSADFLLVQEVDTDSTRSYHVNQYELLSDAFGEYYSVFAQNYNSSFIAYPFHEPHGFCRAGLVLYSRYPITSALRRSFPISTSLSKFVDLDRCFSVSRIPVDNGKELVVMNLHMSAYGNSDEVREGQINMLCETMKEEYEKGNYVICGGDFNHDLKAAETEQENRNSWAYPFPRASLPQHFSFCMDGLSEEAREALWNSARNADEPYQAGRTYTVTLDGFIISDNIECVSYENISTGYSFSDHDPVYMEFVLKK